MRETSPCRVCCNRVSQKGGSMLHNALISNGCSRAADTEASPQETGANDFGAWKLQELMKLYYSESPAFQSCSGTTSPQFQLTALSLPNRVRHCCLTTSMCMQVGCSLTSISADGWLMATV